MNNIYTDTELLNMTREEHITVIEGLQAELEALRTKHQVLRVELRSAQQWWYQLDQALENGGVAEIQQNDPTEDIG